MKLKLTSLAAIALLVIVFASCSNKANIPVPEDAAIVVHIDGASLSSKLPWEEIKKSEWFKVANEEVKDDLAKKILDNPDESGINVKSDAYIFLKTRGRGGYMAFVCGIGDEKKFETFIGKIREGEKVEKKEGLSVIAENSNVLTWNDKRLVFIADNPDINSGASMMGNNGKSRRFDTDSLVKFAKEVYELKGSKSIGSNDKFASMMKEGGDVHFWMNAGSLYSNALPAMLAITKASLLFEGNISAATISFDNGKITAKGRSYYNKELAAVYKKYSMKTLDEEMLKSIPAGDVAALIAMNYPPEGVKEFISLLGVDGLVNMFLAEAGFSVEDFVKANKGDLLLSVSDFSVGEKEKTMTMYDGTQHTYKSTEPDAKILFATSVADKPSFEKLMTILKEKIGQEAGASANDFVNKIPYLLKDNWFIAGSDSASVHSFGAAKTEHSFISKIKGHPMGGFLDIQKFISGSKPSFASDSTATLIADQSLKVWQDIVFHGGEYKDGGTDSYIEINMVDKNTNSLKQLNSYLGFIAVKMKEQEKRREEAYRREWENPATDSAAVIAPPPAK
jgi:hypothetical protein